MGWIIAIIVGGIAGWLASMVMGRDASMGIILNVIVGCVGSVIGNAVAGPLLGVGGTLTLDQAQLLVETAIDECERFYPVFQFVLWGGKSPTEAIAASLIETRGEA